MAPERCPCPGRPRRSQREHAVELQTVYAYLAVPAGSVDSAQAADRTIAEVLRPTFEFVDANKDGKITKVVTQPAADSTVHSKR